MSEIIFHHYPQSPVSEKVRVVFGMKQLSWRSVEIPRLPPKPDLMPLTGGYRRTPVMQIGADIYCDTQCIIRELERRYPEPTLFPGGGAGMGWGLSCWTDGPLLKQVITLVLGADPDNLPPAFAQDRGRLYFGPDFDLQALHKTIPEIIAKLRAQFGWMEQRLATGRMFMLGDTPGLPDALCYYLAWFVRGRYAKGAEFLGQFPHLCSWEQRVKNIGHGEMSDLSPADALNIALNHESATQQWVDAADPMGLTAGMTVAVVPDDDGGDPEVAGKIVYLDAETIGLRRTDERVGEVVVNFPRIGYRIIS